ncbi:MAG: non-lysosomal glucosylceramidase [Chloroflexi bacterium]|nr:non-lysosomal glucosylceramidase [Chloroflexota bacterium]
MAQRQQWPVLTTYDQQHLGRIALPLGGIGAGTVSLGGRGDLRDWEIVNRPAKGFKPRNTFFALYTKTREGKTATRALEGQIDPHEYEGAFGSAAPNHGLPRFRHCRFEAAYPLGQVILSDPGVPLDVRLQAFNPLVPADADRSGIPVAIVRFVLTNKTSSVVTASVCANLENFIGSDGSNGKPSKNENVAVEGSTTDGAQLRGLLLRSQGVDICAEQWGTMALCTPSQGDVTYRTAWADLSWGDSLLDYWDDFSGDGRLENRESPGIENPQASLAVSVKVPAAGTREVTFLLTWHFPNRRIWSPKPEDSLNCCAGGDCHADPNRVGNYYTTQYLDAWDVATRVAPALDQLETDTLAFVNAVCQSDIPDIVKEAALYNLSALRTQTTFRTEDGRMFGWEGCGDKAGCCHGSCTHVWNYEQATAFLFGDLARTMREVEFQSATADNGLMAFRAAVPFGRTNEWSGAAADGQMGCLMKLYRDWQLSGDDDMLQRLWPSAKKALEFCWIPGGWDADRDGVMEGCQHNTMDVEYYGPNPQMGTWYLGALQAAEQMARHVGDVRFADDCRHLFNIGRSWLDEHLFNGQYYEHEVRPPLDNAAIAPGLRVGMGATNLGEPDLQLGAGCLVDQLVGQFMAHVCGLGYLLDKRHIQTTLRSIMKYNFRHTFVDHFNHLRSFVLNDESALLMATYPLGRRPRRPFPYYNEVMTGFEYAAAVHMLYEGQTAAGLKVIKSIRERYDGLKRNPFDEAECGHHYARAMASWAAILALTGFHYSAVEETMTMSTLKGEQFWSTGYGWGTCEQSSNANGVAIKLRVLGGSLKIRQFSLSGTGSCSLANTAHLNLGATLRLRVRNDKSKRIPK